MFMKIAVCLVVVVSIVSALPAVKIPKYLAIYYGWPSYVQYSNGNVTHAVMWFNDFDLIVFGDGIWKTTHGDRANTLNITRTLVGRGKKVFGYVDLGVSTQNLAVSQMKAAVNGWYLMGVTGIFWDDAGYDYGVTRTRQATMIDYCHSKGLSVIMNAWNPDDVMGGTNVRLNSNDIYLLESYLVANGAYTSLTAWETKAKKCANYQSTLGVQMACLSTGTTYDQFTQAWFGTAMYNFDYFQNTDYQYSATNNILIFNPNPSTTYGTTWQSTVVTANTAKTIFSRSTESWELRVTGDGQTWGYGTFIQVPSSG